MDQAACRSFDQSAGLCQWAETEDPSLAVNRSVHVCVCVSVCVWPASWKTIHYLKEPDVYVNWKNPTNPPMNTEPQTSYLLVFSVIIFLWVSWLKSQTQAVAVRAEHRRAGTFTTRYYSSSLLLRALGGKLFKSHLAQTYSPKWDVHLPTSRSGDAAPLAQGTSALGEAVPSATLSNLLPWALPDPVAIYGNGLHGNNAGEMIYRGCLGWVSQKSTFKGMHRH